MSKQSDSKRRQRKDQGDTWEEQDEALFGPITSPNLTLERSERPYQRKTLDRFRAKNSSSNYPNPTPPKYPALRRIPTTNSEKKEAVVQRKDENVIPENKNSHRNSTRWREITNTFHNVSMKFMPKHCICCRSSPLLQYYHHPYFPDEKICGPCNQTTPKCCSCHRWKPHDVEFLPLSDDSSSSGAGFDERVLCPTCLSTAVLCTDDVVPLYIHILDFFESVLGLTVWSGMKEIPILLVDVETMNTAASSFGHEGIWGLTVWHSQTSVMPAAIQSMLGFVVENNTAVTVSKILLLRGLPVSRTTCTLAHEATHAWFRLHMDCNGMNGEKMPPIVEEGCCELISYLYLSHRLESNWDEQSEVAVGKGGQPTERKLQQYFRNNIETNSDDVYGAGFRKAAQAYNTMCNKIGGDSNSVGNGIIGEFMDYVARHNCLPDYDQASDVDS